MKRFAPVKLIVPVIGLWLIAAGCAAPTPAPTATLAPTSEPVTDEFASDPSIGPVDAPVVIQEYGDFSCPSCAVWEAHGGRKAILEKYGDKVRFVWRDYAVLSPQSRPSAEAGHCAQEQGKFWEYHDTLYAHYPDLETADLKRYAAELGLDTAQFNECLDSEKYFDLVAHGLREGIDHGFFATPSFLVNDTPVFGGQPLEVFEKAINQSIGKAE